MEERIPVPVESDREKINTYICNKKKKRKETKALRNFQYMVNSSLEQISF